MPSRWVAIVAVLEFESQSPCGPRRGGDLGETGRQRGRVHVANRKEGGQRRAVPTAPQRNTAERWKIHWERIDSADPPRTVGLEPQMRDGSPHRAAPVRVPR